MKKSRVRRHLIFILLGMLVAICTGCLGLSRENKRPWGDTANPTVGSEANERSAQPSAVKASAPAENVTPEHKIVSPSTAGKAARIGLSEEEKAKNLALDLAKANPNVEKLKVCHDKKSDEWWLTLYEDNGNYFQLRQYTWSVQQDQPEEFLVLKRISKTKLESDLAASDSDRICQVVKYERSAKIPAVASAESTVLNPLSKEAVSSPQPTPAPIPEKTVERKPSTQRGAERAHPPTPAIEKPKGIAQPQTNMVVAAVQAAAKPSPSTGAARSPVSTPDKGAFVQAVAKNSPADIASLREGASIERPTPHPKASDKSERPKARITPDSGVFSLATVKPEQKHLISRQDSKPHSNHRQTEYSHATEGKKPAPQDATASLIAREKQAAVVSSDKVDDQTRHVPTSFVFVYGSGMNHQELLSWLNSNNYESTIVLDAVPGVLDDYDLVWNYYSPSRSGGTVNLEPKKNSNVWGLLVEVEDRGLKAFDKKEGHPLYYTRSDNRVSVKRVNDGKTVFAWIYRAKPNRSGSRYVWPTAEYKQRIVEAAHFWQFPKRYVEKLENLPTR